MKTKTGLSREVTATVLAFFIGYALVNYSPAFPDRGDLLRGLLAAAAAGFFALGVFPLFSDTGKKRWFSRVSGLGLIALAVPTIFVWGAGHSVEAIHGVSAFVLAVLLNFMVDKISVFSPASTKNSAHKRVFIVGAGEAGEMVLREINSHSGLKRNVVGFIDDDPDKLNAGMHASVPVLGRTEQVAELCQQHDVDEVIIAMPSAPGSVIRSVTEQADRMNADLRIVPGIREIIEGDVHWNQIRNVQPEDLLGRETVEVDDSRLRDFLRNKAVLVTGAAGSIGRHLVQELLEYPVSKVLGVDINESELYELEASQIDPNQRSDFKSVLGDIRERETLEAMFSDFKPELVLHAAALKHVPMSERHPHEVVKTNLGGTKNVLDCAKQYEVEDCLVISTDKAVKAENVMGMSKRLNERMVASYQRDSTQTRFCAVRFGNVLGSRGSVVPLFKQQIQRGGPVTVTDPDVKRYFMTPVEAVRLVLTAGSFDHEGSLYVLDLGDPIRILDLAHQLISLSGYEPETEIPITFTGLREGETMEETLLKDSENAQQTEHEKIRWIQPDPLAPPAVDRLNNLIDRPDVLSGPLMDTFRTIID